MAWTWAFVNTTPDQIGAGPVIWDGARFLVPPNTLGSWGESANGLAWTKYVDPVIAGSDSTYSNDFINAALGNGVICACTTYGSDNTATFDGSGWQLADLFNGGEAIAFGNGVFVMVYSGYGNAAVGSDGVAFNWYPTGGSSFYSIAFGNGTFVATPGFDAALGVTADGISWSLHTTTWEIAPGVTAQPWYTVFNEALSLFVSVDKRYGAAGTSVDGVAWTPTAMFDPDGGLGSRDWNLVATHGRFTLAFREGTSQVAISEDGFATSEIVDVAALGAAGFTAAFSSRAASNGTDTLVVSTTQGFLVGTYDLAGAPVEEEPPTIVFEPLVDSPETVGDLVATLPALRFRLSSVDSSLVAELPALAFDLTDSQHQRCPLVLQLPPIEFELNSVALPPLITVGGPLRMILPVPRLLLADTAMAVPQRGDAVFALPALEFTLTDSQHLRGDVVFALPAFDLRLFESGDSHLVMSLPALHFGVAEATAARNFITLQAQPVASVLGSNSLVVHDNVDMADSVSDELFFVLRSRLQVNDRPTMLGHFTMALASSFAARDFLRFVLEAALADTVTFTETQTITPQAVLALASVLQAQDQALGTMNVLATIASALVLRDRIRQDATTTVISGVALADLVEANLTLITTIVDEALLADELTGSTLLAVGMVSSELVVEDGFSGLLTALMELEDGAAFAVRFRTPEGEVYTGYALNLRNAALSTLPAHDFNSFATVRRNGRELTLAAREDGIYNAVDGDTFDGAQIDARVRLGLTDFGSSQLKRITNAFIGYTADGQLRLKVVTTDGGRKKENWYTLRARSADSPVDGRFDVAKGLVARYWGFEVENVDGADFQLDELKVLPLLLQRRKSGR